MIAIGLLVVLGIYLSLFFLVGFKTQTWKSRILWWLVLLLPVILKTWDMPVGYYKYKAACADEGGTLIYVKNPPFAKVIRLDADSGFNIDYAKEILVNYPLVDAVETGDEHFSDARPRAYSRYERNPESPIPAAVPRYGFKPKIQLLDKIANQPGGRVTTERGPSQAEYIVTREREDRAIRLKLTHFWLKKADGTPIAKSTSIVFAWTDSKNTLFGRTATEYCGDITENQRSLFKIVAH